MNGLLHACLPTYRSREKRALLYIRRRRRQIAAADVGRRRRMVIGLHGDHCLPDFVQHIKRQAMLFLGLTFE